MKRKQMSRYPYSAILNGKNKLNVDCPSDISMRSWKKGLAERWGHGIPVEVEFSTDDNRKIFHWVVSCGEEFCRHPSIHNRFYFPSVSKAAWIKMNWQNENYAGVAYAG